MVERGAGSIILNSSTGSLRANGGTIAYGAAKAGVNSLTMGAAAAFAGTNVRVNTLLPGLTETKPVVRKSVQEWCPRAGSNNRRCDFQLHSEP
jgi:NAD(P)-dependent dehydrogenase (short-subunit alcohol dehydrogenase family)